MGIVIQRKLQLNEHLLWVGFTLLSILYFSIRFLKLKNQIHHRAFSTIIIFLSTFISGALLLANANPRNQSNFFAKEETIVDTFIAKLTTEPKIGEKQIRCIGEVISKCDNNIWKRTSGKILFVFPKSEPTQSPQIGFVLLIQKTPNPITGSRNPGGFQSDEYYETKGVFHQVNLDEKSYFIIDYARGNLVILKCIEVRDFILKKLKSFLPSDKKIYGIAEALLIGYQADLDPEQMQVYGRSGVVHIIAISGLHIGILFAVFWWLTGLIPFVKQRPWIRSSFVLVFLWTFTMISGASPSVLRSTVMFSFVLLGKSFDNKSNASATFFLSAFVLLVYDPFLFWSLGFQLSYLAVAGILFLQKPIQSIMPSKNKIVKMLTDMLSVTLAAQLATLPVTLYYFHQFPTYFLLTNIIAVPLSTFILFLEIGIVGFYWISPLSLFLGKITAWLIGWMNRFTETTNTLPFSNIEAIPFDIQDVILCFGMILSVLLLQTMKEKKYMYLMVSWFCLSAICFFGSEWKRNQQSTIIITHQYRNTALFFIKDKTVLCLSHCKDHADSLRFSSLKKGVVTTYRLKKEIHKSIGQKSNLFFLLDGKSFLLVRNEKLTWKDSIPQNVDFMILSENPKLSIKELIAYIQPKQVIITTSNSKRNILRWEKEIDSLPLPCFSIASRGAFIQ